jgi:para-nitrobenzyl esterase
VFDNLGGGRRSESRRHLAGEMSEAWLAFARTGDPNHEGLQTWAPFRPPDRTTDCNGEPLAR